ncbi:MAG: 2-oxoacid:acceptor oxidoreductase subunit alpha [Candidatus Margulisbacteria bacterium]|nr:2-oxoacid:acceptor oxidoreductase subunit alpha [Candidatus Margulisiibacteriota bacterium]MBU1616581.1 2-oxoacid:acceptor oxidoreductase subunit alpha [Candidatus Margulisiibacteriota bacterium]
MESLSILIGGRAGDGIDQASLLIGKLLNQLGFRIYIYRDYPSLIRGGHTFSIVRAAREKLGAHRQTVDFICALNQDCLDNHRDKIHGRTVVLYDSDVVKGTGLALPLTSMVKAAGGPEIVRNTAMLGGLAKALGLPWEKFEKVARENLKKETEINIQLARKGYNAAETFYKIEEQKKPVLPLVTGNEALALGLASAGLDAYISYPMTPSSTILHFLAQRAEALNMKVIHPESELAVIMMALGFAYAGQKTAVGTSGGGFCLMTEGLSFAGMAELPMVIVLGQRPGPSTGLPTYSSQTELMFALWAGQGEFTRLIVAPGDAEEAYYWGGVALRLAWKYQLPAIILTDKNIAEGTYSFDLKNIKRFPEEQSLFWDGSGEYKRYLATASGISPLAFPGEAGATIKVNSYEHEEDGVTTEDQRITRKMQEKRLRKGVALLKEIDELEAVKVYGKQAARTAVVCWGSTKHLCLEAAEKLEVRVVMPLVLSPLPLTQLKKALQGVAQIIAVEDNATAQLAQLLKGAGIKVDAVILTYDGRPETVEQLEERIARGMK